MPAKGKIRNMFDSIAADYDKLNHILSLDVDKIWRKKALREIKEGDNVLDLACGTGDFAIAIAHSIQGSNVTGVDLSEGMLSVMKKKVEALGLEGRIMMETGDGENLRFEENSFDRVTNAFGIRNFENKEKGLKEALRVLKPGGKLVILELSRPDNKVIRWFYDIYFLNILPKIGGSISGDKAAYSYLPASVKAFPGKKEFTAMMLNAGFSNVVHKSFTFGICRMYTGEKPNI